MTIPDLTDSDRLCKIPSQGNRFGIFFATEYTEDTEFRFF